MSAKKSIAVPKLELTRAEAFKSYEMSPRSDEMNEDISSIKTPRSFSLAPDLKSSQRFQRTCKANTPLSSCVHKSDKNPLLRQTSTFVETSFNQSAVQPVNLSAVELENKRLRLQLQRQDQELKQLRRVKVVLRQKEMQLERAEVSLKLAMQESEQLAQELRLRQDTGSGTQTLSDYEEPKLLAHPIHLGTLYKSEVPRREWVHVPSRVEMSMQKFKRRLQTYLDCSSAC
jgi:hypothetical protein